ncbi:MAG: tRNA pseudouridine(13) synthase TruD [Epsilonproteobacteria bacterium]|nr:tRNA pseudouridine(13) synthase TruD [Campylobacterota bacterium]
MIYSHSKINFHFNKNSENFIVEEVPLYSFAHTGEWVMMQIRKKGLTTDELLRHISSVTGAKFRDIGYAGLKDKAGMTIQWISIPRKYRDKIKHLENKNIKILQTDLHRNKLKIGHLKGNNFFVRLKKVTPTSAKLLDSIIKDVKKYGIPNFFGYQRFGKYGDNFEEAKKLIDGDKFVKSKRVEKFLISAYQSKLFNDWLKKRIELSNIFELSPNELKIHFPKEVIEFVKPQKHPFKLLLGDVMNKYPKGKYFYLESDESERFYNKEIVPTGLLAGSKVVRAKDYAWEIEKEFDELIPAKGDRRNAWIFPEIIDNVYKKDLAQYELKFFLPKGSYATVLIDILQGGIKQITY